MRPFVAALAASSLIACATSKNWAWRRPDGTLQPRELASDIDECEAYTKVAEDRGPFQTTRGARPYGGWGNHTFEVCMHQRRWELKLVAPGETPPTTPPPTATPPGAASPPPTATPAPPPAPPPPAASPERGTKPPAAPRDAAPPPAGYIDL